MHNSGISQSKEYNSMKRKKQINIKKKERKKMNYFPEIGKVFHPMDGVFIVVVRFFGG
jgi:uncharacterized protein YllA (UPF0747 family)